MLEKFTDVLDLDGLPLEGEVRKSFERRQENRGEQKCEEKRGEESMIM